MARAKKSMKKSTGKKSADKATPLAAPPDRARPGGGRRGVHRGGAGVDAGVDPGAQDPDRGSAGRTAAGRRRHAAHDAEQETAPGVPGRQLPGRADGGDPRHLGGPLPTDDTAHPGIQFPHALLLPMSRVIGDDFGADRVQVYTVPYAAQFHNPFAQDNQISYNASRDEEATGRPRPPWPRWRRSTPADQLCTGRLLPGRGDRR